MTDAITIERTGRRPLRFRGDLVALDDAELATLRAELAAWHALADCEGWQREWRGAPTKPGTKEVTD